MSTVGNIRRHHRIRGGVDRVLKLTRLLLSTLIILQLSLAGQQVRAATASYFLDGNLDDSAGSHDASSSGDAVTFLDEGRRSFVRLGGDGLITLSAGLSAETFATGVFEISFDFRVEDSQPRINVDRTISLTFVVGAALAAVAGVIVTLYYGVIDFFMGFIAGLKAFTAAVLGGIGSLPGAMLGGLLLGLVEAFFSGYFTVEYKDVAAFGILVLVLIFRPTGLLGEPEIEKV